MQNTWDWLFRAVFKANLAIELLTAAEAPEASIAEVKVLRAYFYYLLMDGWGNVPIVTSTKTLVEDVVQSERADVYEFVVTELEDNVDKLQTTKGGEFYNRFNKWAAYAVLAKVYLNAGVYTGTPEWTKALEACNYIIDNGGFSLVSAENYLSRGSNGLFGDVCSNDEVLFAIYVDALQAPRNIIGIRSLYGSHADELFGFSAWNGATVHQNFVNKYDDGDIRKSQWLVGPQPGWSDPDGYSLNISSFTSAGLKEGARNSKFFPVAPYNGGAASNDLPAYRYADILLMKGECHVRLSQPTAAAPSLNAVRVRAGLYDFFGTSSLDVIFYERG
jgi:hypothetical protein